MQTLSEVIAGGKAQFRAWLGGFGPEDIIGDPHAAVSCPLARYTTAQRGKPSGCGFYNLSDRSEFGPWESGQTTSTWMCRFQERAFIVSDAQWWADLEPTLTAAQCLAIMDQIGDIPDDRYDPEPGDAD